MSFVFFAHAALLGSSCTSRTDVYAPSGHAEPHALPGQKILAHPKKQSSSHLERKYWLKNIF